MKTPGVKVVKRAAKPCRREKRKAKAYSTYIYRVQKEGNSVSKCITVPKVSLWGYVPTGAIRGCTTF
ncbi:hypothetical protein AGOR_G00216930 [Albula goreensis]|uniref:Uncharacterized protein n=1 Tax=Albula goreensis TaxID=1534307 RepID=A0A8T3CNM2_9TELE|nr:hypothetical protein AGOR_G00216930 [Albula goreensis]